ncbi:hypothetical protein KI387_010544, partial [Taxus chinensis]
GIDELLDDWEAGESAVEAVAVVGIVGLDVDEEVAALVEGLEGEGEVGIVADAFT